MDESMDESRRNEMNSSLDEHTNKKNEANDIDVPKEGVKKPPPLKIAIIAFFFIMLYFAIVTAPFLAASAFPDENLDSRYTILVADFDKSSLGSSLKSFINAIPNRMDYVVAQVGGTTSLPNFEITTEFSTIEELKNAVFDQQAFAAIYVASGATDAYSKVYANCGRFD